MQHIMKGVDKQSASLIHTLYFHAFNVTNMKRQSHVELIIKHQSDHTN